MITRNLTPNKNGLPEGGHTLAEFKQIMRHGTDVDHIHPNCTPAQITAINAVADVFKYERRRHRGHL